MVTICCSAQIRAALHRDAQGRRGNISICSVKSLYLAVVNDTSSKGNRHIAFVAVLGGCSLGDLPADRVDEPQSHGVHTPFSQAGAPGLGISLDAWMGAVIHISSVGEASQLTHSSPQGLYPWTAADLLPLVLSLLRLRAPRSRLARPYGSFSFYS